MQEDKLLRRWRVLALCLLALSLFQAAELFHQDAIIERKDAEYARLRKAALQASDSALNIQRAFRQHMDTHHPKGEQRENQKGKPLDRVRPGPMGGGYHKSAVHSRI